MTQQTKPSAGALRAAARLRQIYTFGYSSDEAAHIIDHETGVTELVKAAKAVHDFLWKERGQIVGMTDIKLSEALTRAIDKVG